MLKVYCYSRCCHDFLFDAKSHPASEKHNFVYEKGSHYLTDGKLKYIWYVTSGKEQLFDIVNDYQEACDLAVSAIVILLFVTPIFVGILPVIKLILAGTHRGHEV